MEIRELNKKNKVINILWVANVRWPFTLSRAHSCRLFNKFAFGKWGISNGVSESSAKNAWKFWIKYEMCKIYMKLNGNDMFLT